MDAPVPVKPKIKFNRALAFLSKETSHLLFCERYNPSVG